jgi:hypothetical protein
MERRDEEEGGGGEGGLGKRTSRREENPALTIGEAGEQANNQVTTDETI